MYERNAIVLERYFYEIFSFKNASNLRVNYYNYRNLFECYGTLCSAKEKEDFCQNEFENATNEILKLQKTQEKLYNKSAKFEYSRYVIFSNTTETVDNIEKHLNIVDEDVQKNNEELKELGKKFVHAVDEYNQKDANLKEAIRLRENAQEAYNIAYDTAINCYNGIAEELLEAAKQFIQSDNKENRKELQEIFETNGKNEKNQFDPDVISNTISKSFEIYKAEMDIYLAGYDRISKLFEEIETDSVKMDKHTKYYKDSKAKLDFLNAEKDYIVQFLDNERIGAIYDKKAHRKLMLEACKKFVLDCTQIEKLYDIILKEVAGRSTKKIYKENYNKQYLIDLENASVEPNLDTGKMRQKAIAFVNLNYWRAEGMRSVYTAFENVVTTIYEKDLSEFCSADSKEAEDIIEVEKVEERVDEKPEELSGIRLEPKVRPRKVYYSSKISLANAIYYSLQTQEFAESLESEKEPQIPSEDEELYSVPQEVQEILANVEETAPVQNTVEESIKVENEAIADSKNVIEEKNDFEEIKEETENDTFDLSKLDEIEDEDDTEEYDMSDENEEESILEIYFSENHKNKEEVQSPTKALGKKAGLFQKLVGLNAKKKKEA